MRENRQVTMQCRVRFLKVKILYGINFSNVLVKEFSMTITPYFFLSSTYNPLHQSLLNVN